MNTGHQGRLVDSGKAREIIASGGVVSASIEAHGEDFWVTFRLATGGAMTLAAKGGRRARRWRDLARAAGYVRELGVSRFLVDVANWGGKE